MSSKFRKAIFIVVYAIENNKPIYLILKRKKHWIGWEFPKGGIERFESLKKTVKRETKEETGLEIIKIKKHFKKGKYLYPQKFKDRPGKIGQTYSLYSVQVKKAKPKIDKKEHSTYKWLSYSQALKTITHKDQKDCLKLVNNSLK